MVSALVALSAFLISAEILRRRLERKQLLLAAGACILLLIVAVLAGPRGLVVGKTIGRLLMPIGLLWIAIAAIMWWRTYRADRRGAATMGAVFFALGLFCNEYLAELGLRKIEEPYRADPLAPNQAPLDAVLVLGGGVKRGAADDMFELGPAGDRVALGARLYHTKRTTLLITSGSPIEGFAKPFDSVGSTTTIWRDLGIPEEHVLGLEGARNTQEEMAKLIELARERGFKRVGLVSSAWHLRRAMKLLEKDTGIEVVPLAADHRGDPIWHGAVSVVPTGNGAYLWHTLAWELLGASVGK